MTDRRSRAPKPKKFVEKISEDITRSNELLIQEIKATNQKLSGNPKGDLSALKTLKKNNLVLALNELKDQSAEFAKRQDVYLKSEVYSKGEVYSKDEIGDFNTMDLTKLVEGKIKAIIGR